MSRRYVSIPKDYINFSETKITLGESVAFFFLKKGISRVIFIYDYKNKSMIIEGITSKKRYEHKYPIIEGLNIYADQDIKLSKKPWTYFIPTKSHRDIIDFTRRYLQFKAKPISNDKVLVEDIPMRSMIKVYTSIFDCEESKYITHSIIPRERYQPIKTIQQTNTENIIERLRMERIINNNTKKEIKTQPQPPVSVQQGDVNKEMGNVWGFTTDVDKLPTKEEREMIDRRNKKIILGE